MSEVVKEWRANKRRWDRGVLLALPPGTRVFEDGIGARRTSAGLSWYLYYRAPVAPGARRTKTVQEQLLNCANKTQALAQLVARKASAQAGTYRRQARVEEITLGQLADVFIAARRHLRTVHRYKDHFENHVAPFFGRNALARAITRERVEAFYAAKLDEGCAVASCNYYLTTLRAMLALAMERGFLEINAARAVKTKKANNRRERMLTEAETAALMQAATARTDYLRPLLVLLVGTGMRRGEALALTWADVSLDRGMLRIREAKNDEGRWVPLAANVRAELERWRAVLVGEKYVFPGRRKADGTETHIVTIDKGWRSLCAAAGVTVGRHELRHNFVSQALAAGYSPADIMPITGHRSIRAFEGYAHSMATRKMAMMEAISPKPPKELPGPK